MRSLPLTAFILYLLMMCASATDIVVSPTKRKGAGPWFRIIRSGQTGYMDRNGRTQIRPRFEDGHDFMEGLAAVS